MLLNIVLKFMLENSGSKTNETVFETLGKFFPLMTIQIKNF